MVIAPGHEFWINWGLIYEIEAGRAPSIFKNPLPLRINFCFVAFVPWLELGLAWLQSSRVQPRGNGNSEEVFSRTSSRTERTTIKIQSFSCELQLIFKVGNNWFSSHVNFRFEHLTICKVQIIRKLFSTLKIFRSCSLEKKWYWKRKTNVWKIKKGFGNLILFCRLTLLLTCKS